MLHATLPDFAPGRFDIIPATGAFSICITSAGTAIQATKSYQVPVSDDFFLVCYFHKSKRFD